MLPLIAAPSAFEAAHLGGMIVLGGAFATMIAAVVWHIWTRGD